MSDCLKQNETPGGVQLDQVYGAKAAHARERYARVASALGQIAENTQGTRFFSAPGRIEIAGNHTDHNGGRVLAAAVSVDTIAAVRPRADMRVRFVSEGFPGVFDVDLTHLDAVPDERGSPAALVRGVAARLRQLGFGIGGFDASFQSDVPVGSGLSSSAAFEVLLGRIFSDLYSGGAVGAKELAMIGQFAENVYFGKPCGLMDQTACALGGMVAIDFEDAKNPRVQSLYYDFKSAGFCIAVVNTGGGHEDLTDQYAAIPLEMKSVARALGAELLRGADENAFFDALPRLREDLGDRAVLRAAHFYRENARVDDDVQALLDDSLDGFFSGVLASGQSSWQLLQNVCASASVREQPMAVALAETARLLGNRGAWRVHGGGFAGTILSFVPLDQMDEYKARMEALFGAGALCPLDIRAHGALEIRVQ